MSKGLFTKALRVALTLGAVVRFIFWKSAIVLWMKRHGISGCHATLSEAADPSTVSGRADIARAMYRMLSEPNQRDITDEVL